MTTDQPTTAELVARIDELEARARQHATEDFALGTPGPGNRALGPHQRSRLVGQIERVTGARSHVEALLRQAYLSLRELEARGIGRIAGSTTNVLGKTTATPLLDAPEGPVLEIGTLFGIFGAGLLRQYRRVGQRRRLVVVDPLEGVQIQPDLPPSLRDPSGSPVTRDSVVENFRLAGTPDEDWRLVQGYSTDPATRADVGDGYAVVIVDGDHSAEGVYADLEWVEGIVRPGAVIVLDDYGDPRWEGVQAAAKSYLQRGGVPGCGSSARSPRRVTCGSSRPGARTAA